MAKLVNNAIRGAIVGHLVGAEDISNFLENGITLNTLRKVTHTLKKYDSNELFLNQSLPSYRSLSVQIIQAIAEYSALLDKFKNYDKSVNGAHIGKDDGGILCWIFPIAFYDLYSNYEPFGKATYKIANATHDSSSSYTCVEYTMLLHDIFWNNMTQEDILKILPELDILAGDVPYGWNIKDVFFAGMWCFVHSTSFDSAMNNVLELYSQWKSDNKDVAYWVGCVAGTLAGLYFGVEDSSNEYFSNPKVISVINSILL